MKKMTIITNFVILFALTGCSPELISKDDSSKFTELKQEISRLKNDIAEKEIRITTLEKTSKKLDKQIAKLKETPQSKDELAERNNKQTDMDAEETSEWKTYKNKQDGYSIRHPSEFRSQHGRNIANYDIDDPRYGRGNHEGLRIQIQKHELISGFDLYDEYRNHYKEELDEFTDPTEEVRLGKFITRSQYTKKGPGGAFMTYTAFDKNTKNYFYILVFEPGYSKNKELVEKIVSTFDICKKNIY